MSFTSYLWLVAVFGWVPLIHTDELSENLIALRQNEVVLELAAESSVHISTYGSLIVGFFLFGAKDGKGSWFVGPIAVSWFVCFHVVSYWARVLLRDLEREEAEISDRFANLTQRRHRDSF